MTKRLMAVVLGAAVLAVPGTAVAGNGHGKGKGQEKAAEKRAKHESKSKKGKRDAKAKKPVTFVFKGVYKGDGVVTVSKGNAHARKGGYVGTDVTFDLSAAKLVVADTDGTPGSTAADLQVGDEVLVQARLPRGTKAPAPVEAVAPAEGETTEAPAAEAIKARKVVDKTHPPVSDDEGEDAPAPAPAA